FMKKLIVHIPEAQFKMIRYYGIYATCKHLHKKEIKKRLSSNESDQIKKANYRQDLIAIFDTDPLLCDCGHYMEYVDNWVPPNKRKGVDLYDST
ncbi:MAG: transposase, partial [Bacilli bacterium]|nr:transposase [Bacilli bacterium]